MFIDSLFGGQVTRAMVGISFDVADAARLDSVALLEAAVVRFEAHVAEARTLHESVAVVAGRLRDGSEVMDDDQRARTIDRMLSAEVAYSEGREMLVARSRAGEAQARHKSDLLPFLQRITALIDEDLRLRTDAARDLRWALLELEAAAEPAADGPVLRVLPSLGHSSRGCAPRRDADHVRPPRHQGAAGNGRGAVPAGRRGVRAVRRRSEAAGAQLREAAPGVPTCTRSGSRRATGRSCGACWTRTASCSRCC